MSGPPPLEVLHVVESLGHGGAEQNLLSLLGRLGPDRFRHHLAYLYDDTVLAEAYRPHLASLVPLAAGRGAGLVVAAASLARWLRRHRIDVIHTQLVRAQLVARLATHLAARPTVRRLPVVSTWQSVVYHPNAAADLGPPLRRALTRWLDRQSGRGDRRFIAVSEHVAAEMCAALGVARERVSVIPNCVEPRRYTPASPETLARLRAELGLGPEARVILAVGRLVLSKGHHLVIEAMPEILRRLPHAVLLVAGGGPLAVELAARARALTLGDRVRLLGPRGDMPALYQLAELFAFPTFYEGLSVALLEALANGLPAVVSDIPPNREVADGLDSVRFVALGDSAGLARAAIERLLAGAAARQAALAARDLVRTRFDPARLGERFGEVLAQAAWASWGPAAEPAA